MTPYDIFPTWQALLAAYAVCFGVREKCRFLDGIHPLLDGLLECPYCVGFHSGWAVWLLAWAAAGRQPGPPLSVLVWMLVSAAFCYVVDVVVAKIENGGP